MNISSWPHRAVPWEFRKIVHFSIKKKNCKILKYLEKICFLLKKKDIFLEQFVGSFLGPKTKRHYIQRFKVFKKWSKMDVILDQKAPPFLTSKISENHENSTKNRKKRVFFENFTFFSRKWPILVSSIPQNRIRFISYNNGHTYGGLRKMRI